MIRLAELVGTMSLAGETGFGHPDEQGIRAAVLASALAEEVGATEQEAADAYWLCVLRLAGCTADSDLAALVMGDEVDVHKEMNGVDFAEPAEFLPFLLRTLGRGKPLPARILTFFASMARMPALMNTGQAHCEVGDRMAQRFGLGETTRKALFQIFERWDGRGLPNHVPGELVERASRIANVAGEAEIGHQLGGVDGAVALVQRRRGRMLEPDLVDRFVARAAPLCSRIETGSTWGAYLAAEPGTPPTIDDAAFDEGLAAMGDFTDLKCRFTRGHSAGVAALARAAAEAGGLTRAERTLVERAGWVHDVGRVAVTAGIWDAPRPLTDAEWDRVRLHPHVTERILCRSPALSPLGELSALAHERLDGKGYSRRLVGSGIPPAARLLAAADAYQAMTEIRPHRAALSAEKAADELRAEARSGRLDGEMVEAVLGAAGHRVRARAARPGALSDREVEVIRLLARGLTNKEIGVTLGISTKTAGHHVQHVFEKSGVTTRAAAAMYAMHHGLV